MRILKVCTIWVAFSVVGSPVVAETAFDTLKGKWVGTTNNGALGEPIIFAPAFAGYDAWISWWGQTSLTPSSVRGSHVKVTGSSGSCYYYVGIINQRKITWSLRASEGPDPRCPPSAVFERDP